MPVELEYRPRRVVWVGEGRDGATPRRFFEEWVLADDAQSDRTAEDFAWMPRRR